jgi:hypothetical protein
MYNQRESGRILDNINTDGVYENHMIVAEDMNTYRKEWDNYWKKS